MYEFKVDERGQIDTPGDQKPLVTVGRKQNRQQCLQFLHAV